MNILRKEITKRSLKIGYCILFLGFVVLIIRSFFGFCWSDESFYLSTVHRLYLGDRLLIDEWHPTQFYAVLLLPIYRLYIFLNGSTDGVYLAARILSNGIIFSAALYCYRVWVQKYSAACACLCALFYMFYSRSNVDGLTYHNLVLTFAMLGMTALFDAFCVGGRWQSLKIALGGVALGLMVACNPYQVVFYVIISLILGIYYGKKRGVKRIGVFWVGTLLTAALYLIWLFRRQEIGITLVSVKNVFRDPEHGGG